MPLPWRPGLRALTGDHSHSVANGREAARSANVDTALKQDHPNAARWDYLVEPSPENGQDVVGIEVHPASSPGEVKVMIKKMAWAKGAVAHHEPDLRVTRWVWIATGKVGLPRTTREAKALALAGIEYPQRETRL